MTRRCRLLHANEQHIRGGTEFGFMSCSTNRDVALQYGESGYLFELTTGIVTRGANLAWLSYYPEEKEVCLPPCTALELRRRDRMEHNAVVMELAVVRSGRIGYLIGALLICVDKQSGGSDHRNLCEKVT